MRAAIRIVWWLGWLLSVTPIVGLLLICTRGRPTRVLLARSLIRIRWTFRMLPRVPRVLLHMISFSLDSE